MVTAVVVTCKLRAAQRPNGENKILARPITNQQSGHAEFPRKSSKRGITNAANTMPNPPPVPKRMAIERALRLGLSLNKPDTSAPAVENEIAPKIPAKNRRRYCIAISANKPVKVKTADVVSNPKANSF